jgi:DNA-binding Lrp family transcriptional regulator
MKEVVLKLVSELMKNSRRSDRDLARAIGTSQPTVTRIRNKLEKEGYIKEYTMIPDFRKLGYELLVLTFVELRKVVTPEEVEKARKIAKEILKNELFESVMAERGLGLGYTGLFISFHKDYASYLKFTQWLRKFTFLEVSKIDSFLINLADEIRYRPLTLSTLAKHLLTLEEKKE